MWIGEIDLNTLHVDKEIFESGKKKCGFKNIRIRVDGALERGKVQISLYSGNRLLRQGKYTLLSLSHVAQTTFILTRETYIDKILV